MSGKSSLMPEVFGVFPKARVMFGFTVQILIIWMSIENFLSKPQNAQFRTKNCRKSMKQLQLTTNVLFLCFFCAKWSCLVCTRPRFGKMSQIIFLVDISSPVCLFPFRASRNRPNVLQRFSSSVMQSLEYCFALMWLPEDWTFLRLTGLSNMTLQMIQR